MNLRQPKEPTAALSFIAAILITGLGVALRVVLDVDVLTLSLAGINAETLAVKRKRVVYKTEHFMVVEGVDFVGRFDNFLLL